MNAGLKKKWQGNNQLMSALTFAFGPSFEVVISGDSDKEDTQAMLKALQKNYFLNNVVLFRPIEFFNTI